MMSLAALVLSGCGGDDSPAVGSQEPAAAVPEFTCEFAPNDDPGVIGAGRATIIGVSEQAHEQLAVELELTGPDGVVTTQTFLPYVQSGEAIAAWTAVLDDSAGTDLSCEVTSVTSQDVAGDPQLDPAGASCTATKQAFGWDLTSDLSGVAGFPADAAMFVGTVVQLDGKRYSMDEQELDPGETTLVSSVQADTEPTCVVRYVRPL